MAENHQVVYLCNEVVVDHESRLHYVVHKIFWLLSHGVIRRSLIWLPAAGRAGFRFFRGDLLHYRLQFQFWEVWVGDRVGVNPDGC